LKRFIKDFLKPPVACEKSSARAMGTPLKGRKL
jgi:hypothetical protein